MIRMVGAFVGQVGSTGSSPSGSGGGSGVDSLGDILRDVLKSVFDATIQPVLDWIIEVGQMVWSWFYHSIVEFRDALWGSIVGNFPEVGEFFESVRPYYEFADSFIDIQVCLTSVGVYLTFWASWSTYRAVKSWIPTVSG